MLNRLKLVPKLTLVLLLVFVVGSSISGFVLSKALQHRAEDRMTAEGIVLMETMQAVRRYTDEQIRPLLTTQLGDDFKAEMIPAYSARRVFELLQTATVPEAGTSPDGLQIRYKQAVLNPTNPDDRADAFEAELTHAFIQRPETEELSGFRTSSEQGLLYYSALPIRIQQASCLECHGDPADAPDAMLALYGDERGFGWRLNETVGIQVVYVPAAAVFQDARQAFSRVMAVFFGVFAIALLCLNQLLRSLVLAPIQLLAKIAQALAKDKIDTPDDVIGAVGDKLSTVVQRHDELGQLGRIFQGMVQEMMLRQQWLQQQIRRLQGEVDDSTLDSLSDHSEGRTGPQWPRDRRRQLEWLMLKSRLVRQTTSLKPRD